MRNLTGVLLVVLACGCSKPPTVDFGPDKTRRVVDLEAELVTSFWHQGVRAFQEVVDLDGYCRMRGVFRKFSRNGDSRACEALIRGCLDEGKSTLPTATYVDWQMALLESCNATLEQVERCTNDALKQLDSALSSVDCNTPPQMLEHKLKVPESCQLLEQSCIIPTLSYYIRNAGSDEDD